MKKGRAINRSKEILEEVFYQFRDEVFCYSLVLCNNRNQAVTIARNAFAKYFRAFSLKQSLSNAKLELLQNVWISISQVKRWSRKPNQTLFERSIHALGQVGLTAKEIGIVMGIRSDRIESFSASTDQQIETMQSMESNIREILRTKLTVDEIWEYMGRAKRLRRKTNFLVGCLVCVLVALSSGYYYNFEHRPPEKSQISMVHPLHLSPDGPILHTCMWSGESTVEQWQNTETGQRKSIYRDQNLEEIKYSTNTMSYILEYKNGNLESAIKVRMAPDSTPLLQRMNKNALSQNGETVYDGISVDVYADESNKFYVDKKSGLILFEWMKGQNGSESSTYYGYEYLQSVGYGFFDPPTDIHFVDHHSN